MAGWIEPGVVFSGVEISAPGSGPIVFGNLRSTYTIVDRQATTVLHGPYSAGFCHLSPSWRCRNLPERKSVPLH
jgi:hypothetical protein